MEKKGPFIATVSLKTELQNPEEFCICYPNSVAHLQTFHRINVENLILDCSSHSGLHEALGHQSSVIATKSPGKLYNTEDLRWSQNLANSEQK